MRNQFRKPKNVNCAYSVFLTKLSSANKREEQSDERFKPTSFEQRWDMNRKTTFVVRVGIRPAVFMDFHIHIPL